MKHIDRYVDAYFEGTLSQTQEKRLKAFLCSKDGQASEYDEIRAVMGYFSMGSVRRRGAAVWVKFSAAAAALILFIAVGLLHSGPANVCVAYVDGKKISDEKQILRVMETTLEDLVTDAPDVEQELREFFAK